ncbi:hypothetical protein MBLNU230_g6848t1 [Neophaeotheca triangularis]
MSESEDGQGGVPLIEKISPSPSPETTSTKRKREDDSKPTSKRAAKKQKQTKKPKDIDDEALDVEAGVNHAIAHMDSKLMADHVAQRTRRHLPDLSMVEIEDLYIPEKAIINTSRYEKSRATQDLADFVQKFAGPRRKKKGEQKLIHAAEEKGHPHTLVIAPSGIRAADLTRALRQYQTKESMVAKLFAKHIKLKEATEMAKKTRMGIGVGTPQRLLDLLDAGALSASKLERIVVDASHIDQKKRGILDMKEIQVPLLTLLSKPEFKERYGAADDKRIDLLFF